MKIIRLIKSSIAVAGMSLVAGIVLADCNFADGTSTLVRTSPLLGGNLTVGRDVPLGAEIYQQVFMASTSSRVDCSPGLYNIGTSWLLPSTPLPLANWSRYPYSGRIYETGVPGIGVALRQGVSAMPFGGGSITNCGDGTAVCAWNLQSSMSFTISLIKIGDVSPGTIQGSQLPTAQLKWGTPLLDLSRVNFSGSINIVSRTCETPDVSVAMGTHKISEFSGKDSFTEWKNFSIALNNCPAFNGYYQSTGPNWSSNGSVGNLDSRKNNVLQVRLDPTRAAVLPDQGIMSLNPSAAGDTPAATGIGLQVADSSGTPLSLATLSASGITPQAVEGASYSIPFKARYIQTGDSVTAGPANATATFTINYY